MAKDFHFTCLFLFLVLHLWDVILFKQIAISWACSINWLLHDITLIFLIILIGGYDVFLYLHHKNGVRLRQKQRHHGHPMEERRVSDGNAIDFRQKFKFSTENKYHRFPTEIQISNGKWFFTFCVGMRCPHFSREERESELRREREGARKSEKAEDSWFPVAGDWKKELPSCI